MRQVGGMWWAYVILDDTFVPKGEGGDDGGLLQVFLKSDKKTMWLGVKYKLRT